MCVLVEGGVPLGMYMAGDSVKGVCRWLAKELLVCHGHSLNSGGHASENNSWSFNVCYLAWA